MAVEDLQTFIRERTAVFDSTIDVSPGSPFDQQVVQPIVNRLGQDPFTVDLATFIHDRLQQAYPDMAAQEGDAITDLLIKPARLLWDPIVREITRIRNSQSLQDPSQLTSDEAEALLANIFIERNKGTTTKGPARIYFQQPRDVAISPINFFTTKTGLRFFPDGVQSITASEMLLNLSGGLYYFDVNTVAEAPGVDYNIDAGEIVSVANVEAAVRVTNLRRFRDGVAEESVQNFIDRSSQDLTERSLVTQRGIGAVLGQQFPEITRLGLVGFGDPEMRRDILKGGGLGAPLASGTHAMSIPDGANRAFTRRVTVSDTVDFTTVIGPIGAATGYVLSLVGGFASAPQARDLDITRVVGAATLEVADQVINPVASNLGWCVRRKTLTLSGIPGGILFPNSGNGAVEIADDEVHVGGLYDVHARGASTESATITITNLADSNPLVSGSMAQFVADNQVSLADLIYGTDYATNDPLFTELSDAGRFGYTLEVLDGPNAGIYRIVSIFQLLGGSPLVTLDSSPGTATGQYRWRLVNAIEVDLVEPKRILVSGSDLATVQNTTTVQTATGTDFLGLGVAVGMTLRINDGPDAGDYTVKAIPLGTRLTVDRPFVASTSSLSYLVFSPGGAGVDRPFVRIASVDLLDSNQQPLGTSIPYGKPVDCQSRAFQNPGRGPKVEVVDAQLGIVTLPAGLGFAVSGQYLTFSFPNPLDGLATFTVSFVGTLTAAQLVQAINTQAQIALGPEVVLSGLVGTDRVGIVPLASIVVIGDGTARTTLFGSADTFTTADIRSADVTNDGGWLAVSPAIGNDNLDALNVLDGGQIGFYGGLHPTATALVAANVTSGTYQPSTSFAPEIGRHIQIGARSVGSARLYFLDPTSIEFDADSRFSATLPSGALVRYFPDPTVRQVKIPARPSTVLPKDGSGAQFGNTFTSSSSEFVLSNIRIGDELDVLYIPITGTATLTDPVTGLKGKTLILSIDGSPDQTIEYVSDLSGFPNDVSLAGTAAQINDAVGLKVAAINGSNLEFVADVALIVRKGGTANSTLGFSAVVDTANESPHHGKYSITAVTATTLTVAPSFPASTPGTVTRESFTILRAGGQRISTADLQNNKAEAGLYYFDVELVSEGAGDAWNIPAAIQLTPTGYRADGYWLESQDQNLTFSPVEKVLLKLSKSILDTGVSDDPQNAIQLSGQNIEITYDRSTLVGDVQSFVLADTERVVCANPLVRHLIPHYVRFDFTYLGGSDASVVEQDMEQYINGLFPADLLESSDLQGIAAKRGATSIRNPIDLLAVVHNYDRSVWIQRSQDSLNTGRLAAFIPDLLNINRTTGG